MRPNSSHCSGGYRIGELPTVPFFDSPVNVVVVVVGLLPEVAIPSYPHRLSCFDLPFSKREEERGRKEEGKRKGKDNVRDIQLHPAEKLLRRLPCHTTVADLHPTRIMSVRGLRRCLSTKRPTRATVTLTQSTDFSLRIKILVHVSFLVLTLCACLSNLGANLGRFLQTRVGFPMDRLAPSAVRQLYTEQFHFPSSLECVELLYDKLFIQVRGNKPQEDYKYWLHVHLGSVLRLCSLTYPLKTCK